MRGNADMLTSLMCIEGLHLFSLGMTSNHICYCGTPHVCVVTEVELDRIMKGIHYEFVKDGGKNSIFTQGMM